MPWRRPHPNHLFLLELLKTHLQEEPEPKTDPAERAKSWGRDRDCVRRQIDNSLSERYQSGAIPAWLVRPKEDRLRADVVVLHDAAGMSQDPRNQPNTVETLAYPGLE